MTATLNEDQYVFLIISRSFLLRMRNVSDKICRENQNTHFVFNDFFFENCAVYEIMRKKYCRAGQATDDNMAHADCMLDTYGYKYTIRICNSYCFSTAKMVLRIHISVTRTLSVFLFSFRQLQILCDSGTHCVQTK